MQFRETLSNIMHNTTAMPFRRYGNKYRCFYCNTSFPFVSDLRVHTLNEMKKIDAESVIVKHIPDQYVIKFDITELNCKLCSKILVNLETTIEHLIEHDKGCNKEFLPLMLEFKLSDDNLNCLICNKEFKYFGPLLLHTHRTHKSRQYKCHICEESFSSSGNLNKHSRTIHAVGKPKISCRYCEKKFHAVHRRDDHEKRIHSLDKNKCSICSKILGSEYKRNTHLALVHNIWTTKYDCTKCSKVFRFKHQLVDHDKRVHLKEKNVTCEVCGHKFFDNHLLKLHSVRHSNDRPFKCNFCDKSFPRKGALDFHVRIHTNDRRCICNVCGRTFIQLSSLNVHMKVHKDDQ